MNKCLFCEIVSGKIKSEKVYEDDFIYAFKDINPIAPIHYLFISKNHSEDIVDLLESNNAKDLVHIFNAIKIVAKRDEKIREMGFRVINNCGENAGQSVFHTHFHLVSGKRLSWPTL